MHQIVNPGSAYAEGTCLGKHTYRIGRGKFDEVNIPGKVARHIGRVCRRVTRVDAFCQRRKDFRQTVRACCVVSWTNPAAQLWIMQRLDQGRRVPIGFHRLSRTALMARTIAERSSRTAAPTQRPFTLRARTSGISLSTNSISRMLPSGWRSAENAFFGVKRLLQASRPFSSATNFIMGYSHQPYPPANPFFD